MSLGTDSLSSHEFCLKKFSSWYHFIGFLSVLALKVAVSLNLAVFWGNLQQLNILNCLMILTFTALM